MECIVCGRPFGDPEFVCYGGDIALGPAYWSDKGLLCSPRCSLDHYMERVKNGEKLVPSKRPEPPEPPTSPTLPGIPRK